MDHDEHMSMGGGDMTNMTAPMTMMHMSFFWGSNAEILFSGWPGKRPGMYALALIFVFALSVMVEWFSHARFIKPETANAAAGLLQTAMHTVRVVLAYLVMLAVMSFNVGVLLVAVAGHALGFFLFGSRVFRRQESAVSAYDRQKHPDLPPMSC